MRRGYRPTQSSCSLHDCRPENIKYKQRNPLYDTSVLSKGLYRTFNSTLILNEKYLFSQRNFNDLINQNIHREKILKQVESGGDGDMEYDDLKWPNSITCSSFGDIIVCDTSNHRLLVFNRELVYKYTIGSKGNYHGQFDEPFDIVISCTNNLMIADKNNNRIEIFEEHLVFQQSKTKINAFIRSDVKIQTNPDGTQSAIVKNSSRSNSIQYKYKSTIEFNDKPIKLCTSTISAICLAVTINGFIFIFNSSNRILSSIKFNEHTDLFDLRNTCIHRNGNQFIILKNQHNLPTLFFYQFQDTLINKLKNVASNKNTVEIDNLNKINLVNTIQIQHAYYPGVCLDRGLHMKQTPDSNYLVVYDSRNLCVLLYNYDGAFLKVLFHSYDYLEQLLAMTFSPEGHFVTCEYVIRNNKVNNNESNGRSISAFSHRYVFKIKIYRYQDCDCHRNRPSITKKRINHYTSPTTKQYLLNYRNK